MTEPVHESIIPNVTLPKSVPTQSDESDHNDSNDEQASSARPQR